MAIMATDRGVAYMRGVCRDRSGEYALHRVPSTKVPTFVSKGFVFVRWADPEASRVPVDDSLRQDATADQETFADVLPREQETLAIESAIHSAVAADRADSYLKTLFGSV